MYIDESGNADMNSSENPNHRFLSLCGVIVELDYVNNVLATEFEDMKNRYFGKNADNPVVLHRKEMLNAVGPFKVFEDTKLRDNFNRELLDNLSKWQYTTITVMIDKQQHRKRYKEKHYHPYHYCFEVLLEKFCSFLKGNEAVGDMMIEARNKRDDAMLKTVYSRLFNDGTAFQKTPDLFITSTELKIRPKKMNIAGLQLADLFAQPMRNVIMEKYGLRERKIRHGFSVELTETIMPKVYSKQGRLYGYGLKKLP